MLTCRNTGPEQLSLLFIALFRALRKNHPENTLSWRDPKTSQEQVNLDEFSRKKNNFWLYIVGSHPPTQKKVQPFTTFTTSDCRVSHSDRKKKHKKKTLRLRLPRSESWPGGEFGGDLTSYQVNLYHLESRWRSPLPLALVYHGPLQLATYFHIYYWLIEPHNPPPV